MSVEHWDAAADGLLSEEGLRRKLEARGYAVSRYVYPPGTRFPPHAHGIDKIDAVVSGRFRMTMGDVDARPRTRRLPRRAARRPPRRGGGWGTSRWSAWTRRVRKSSTR